MGTLGDLFEQRTRLMSELAEVKSRMKEFSSHLSRVTMTLGTPDHYSFEGVRYHPDHQERRRETFSVEERYFAPAEIKELHRRYVDLGFQIRATEKAITDNGGIL